MKKDIHPTYYEDATISCFCGNSMKTGSTAKNLKVEICSACHPFFTGKKKIVDSTGRVDRFKKLTEKSAVVKEVKAKAAKKQKAKPAKKEKTAKKK